MDAMVREFALQMLRKLQLQPNQTLSKPDDDVTMDGDGYGGKSSLALPDDSMEESKPDITTISSSEDGEDENMEDGQLPPEALVHTPYLPEVIELPAKKAHVLQHVELLFALSVKVPEFLDE